MAAATENMKSQPDQRHVFKVSTTNSNEKPKCLSTKGQFDFTGKSFYFKKLTFKYAFLFCLKTLATVKSVRTYPEARFFEGQFVSFDASNVSLTLLTLASSIQVTLY